jgi:DNA-binding CsgD family transcriptional regulator
MLPGALAGGQDVMSGSAISEEAVLALLGMIRADRTDLLPVGLPVSLLADLISHIPCDVVTFSGQDTGRSRFTFAQYYYSGGEHGAYQDEGDSTPADDSELAYWAAYAGCDHCAYPDGGDQRSITRTSDFYTLRQWHSTAMYAQALHGIDHMLMVCLPSPAPSQLRLVLHRGPGRDFGDRDRALLQLLRPHLRAGYLHAEQSRHPVPSLTPRQRGILRLVAVGHTNAQIARRLGVSPGTVRIHLQNIYTTLQVPNRTAAVTRVFPGHTSH